MGAELTTLDACSIRILFSISDLDASEAEAEAYEDDAAVEGSVAEEPAAEDDAESGFPIETTITVTKPGQGALTIDAVAEGAFSFCAGKHESTCDAERRTLELGTQS